MRGSLRFGQICQLAALAFWSALTTAAQVAPRPPQAAQATVAQLAATPVFVVTDCGVDMDDQWALAHLALSPDFHITGVITTHALSLPAPAAQASAQCARDVFDHLPLLLRPVV